MQEIGAENRRWKAVQTGMAARKKWLALVITEIVIFVTGMGIWLGGELSFREYTGDELPFSQREVIVRRR